MKNLFYFAINLAANKEINGTGDLMFTLLGRLLITDRQTEAIIPLQCTLNYLSLRKSRILLSGVFCFVFFPCW